MPDTDLRHMVRRIPAEEAARVKAAFRSADPFPHVVIDDFFTEAFFTQLQRDFPQRGAGYDRFCREDGGEIGTNYANGEVASFPPAFRTLDALIASPAFRRQITELTGIDGLEYDATYFGGGIRESASGTFLPAHLDFNHHPQTQYHRRMNLLFYLNDEWDAGWGGNLQVHRDPNVFTGDTSLVQSYPPLRNRCLIFETSEISWHGFDRLALPEGKSRRAFTVYYYTEHRPDEAAVKLHNTEYVEPPLPGHFKPGHVLTEADVALLQEAIARRDGRIRMLYQLRMQMEEKMRNFTLYALRTAGHRAMARIRRTLGR
jgi:hypothetical protein